MSRNTHKELRNKVGNEIYLSPGYLANIENKGQRTGLQFLFGDTAQSKSMVRIPLDPLLDGMTEDELRIVIND